MKKIVVLVSGQGSNLQALIDAQQQGRISGEISAVFSNNPDAYGLERAKLAGIAHHALDDKAYADRASFDLALAQAIDQYQPDLLVLAGYMRILSPEFVQHYAGRMLNIHPSLLPKYPACIPIVKHWKTVTRNTVPQCILSQKNWMVAQSSCKPKSRSLVMIAKRM
uniref:Phosphoribosylglycinamide formyltransferase n=1 Tax=Yersinia enterocolitica W22703 TaxID=913028 RepID=F4N5D3_YEREN|nr:phosphoribosylglycinamide formyltransferase [Yersinia enterocolitica W22703]